MVWIRFENKWFKDCTYDWKPVFYRRYVVTYLYCFPLSIMSKYLKSIYLLNIES